MVGRLDGRRPADCLAWRNRGCAPVCVAQGFLTAMKQEVNRKHAADKWALDDVVMTSEVSGDSWS